MRNTCLPMDQPLDITALNKQTQPEPVEPLPACSANLPSGGTNEVITVFVYES